MNYNELVESIVDTLLEIEIKPDHLIVVSGDAARKALGRASAAKERVLNDKNAPKGKLKAYGKSRAVMQKTVDSHEELENSKRIILKDYDRDIADGKDELLAGDEANNAYDFSKNMHKHRVVALR